MSGLPAAFALCLEDLEATGPGTRYLCCVAMPGGQPGLGLGADAAVLWRQVAGVAVELWISADERLVARRRDASGSIVLFRGNRSLQLPIGKPVVVLDHDLLEVGGRRLRMHVHGHAPAAAPPTPYESPAEIGGPDPGPSRGASTAARLATAMTVSALAVGCQKEAIEVRDRPPEPMATVPLPSASTDVSPEAGPPPEASAPNPKPELTQRDLVIIRGLLAEALESSESEELQGLASRTRTEPCVILDGVARIGLWVQSAEERQGHRFIWRRALTLGPAFTAEVERDGTGWRVKSVGPLHISPRGRPAASH